MYEKLTQTAHLGLTGTSACSAVSQAWFIDFGQSVEAASPSLAQAELQQLYQMFGRVNHHDGHHSPVHAHVDSGMVLL